MDAKQRAALPKVDLHCHLDGSLSPDFVRKRLGEPILDSNLRAAETCGSLTEYLEKFRLPLSCLQDEEGLHGAAYDLLRAAAAENIRYLEVRFAPQLCLERGLTVRRVLEAVLQGLHDGKADFAVDTNIIVCAMRHMTDEDNLGMLRQARDYLGQGVCAADLAGDENAHPTHAYAALFEQVRRLDMPFVMHAGECGSVQNVCDAIACGARRIGHGIAMQRDPAVQRLCRERGIGVELCPHSNLQTGAATDLSLYPIGQFLRAGVPASVNTDNRTVSGCTISDELELVQQYCGVTDAQVYTLLRNAVVTSFASDDVKHRLLREIAEGESV